MVYFSRKLTPTEQTYDIRNRELLVVKLAPKPPRLMLYHSYTWPAFIRAMRIFPPSCFVGVTIWELDQVITCTPPHQILHSCPLNKIFVQTKLQPQLKLSTQLHTHGPPRNTEYIKSVSGPILVTQHAHRCTPCGLLLLCLLWQQAGGCRTRGKEHSSRNCCCGAEETAPLQHHQCFGQPESG